MDLPHVLLVAVLSRKHSKPVVARSASSTCRGMRLAALESVTRCHARGDNALQAIVFARTLPLLRSVRLTALNVILSADNLCALAALTRLQSLDVENPRMFMMDWQGWERHGRLHFETCSHDLSTRYYSQAQVSVLTALTGLRHLSLVGCGLGADASYFAPALTRLQTLRLERSGIFGVAARALPLALASVKSLRSLNLSWNFVAHERFALKAGTLPFLAGLSRLTALARLEMRSCRFKSADVARLSSLSTLAHLDLSHNEVGVMGAQAIACSTGLRHLVLNECQVTPQGAEAFSQRLTVLTHLELSGIARVWRPVEDEEGFWVARIPSLVSLVMMNTALDWEVAEQLSNLTGLTSLCLADNCVWDEGAGHLTKLTRLRRLNLDLCGLKHAGAVALSKMTNLVHLSLFDNSVGDEGAALLRQLSALTCLNMSPYEGSESSSEDG